MSQTCRLEFYDCFILGYNHDAITEAVSKKENLVCISFCCATCDCYIYTHTITDGNCQPIIHYDVPTKRFCAKDEVVFTNGMMRTQGVVDCNRAIV